MNNGEWEKYKKKSSNKNYEERNKKSPSRSSSLLFGNLNDRERDRNYHDKDQNLKGSNNGKNVESIAIHPLLLIEDEEILKREAASLKAGTLSLKPNIINQASIVSRYFRKPVESLKASDNPYFNPKFKDFDVNVQKRSSVSHPQGYYIRKANNLRQRKEIEQLQKEIYEISKNTECSMELLQDFVQGPLENESEWWDLPFLNDQFEFNNLIQRFLPLDSKIGSSSASSFASIGNLDGDVIPSQSASFPHSAPMIIRLTRKERKKLRRQRRLQEQREKREQIQLGLLPPEKTRRKVANITAMMLDPDGNMAPTSLAKEIMEEAETRKKIHEDANKSRQRIGGKIFKESSGEIIQCAFKLPFSNGKIAYKIAKNAMEYSLTGVFINYNDTPFLLLVEGGPRGIRKYKNLILNRMYKNEKEKMEATIFWEGTKATKIFSKFFQEKFNSEYDLKMYLEKHNLQQFYNIAKN